MSKTSKKKPADIVTDSIGSGVTTSAPGNPCSGVIGPSGMYCWGGAVWLLEPPTAAGSPVCDPTLTPPGLYYSRIAGGVEPGVFRRRDPFPDGTYPKIVQSMERIKKTDESNPPETEKPE